MKQCEKPATDEVEIMAEAIFEVDEDLLDEAVAAAVAAGNKAAMYRRIPRVSWLQTSNDIRETCRRRARAAVAAVQVSGKVFDFT